MSTAIAAEEQLAPDPADAARIAAHRQRSMFFLAIAAGGVGFALTLQLGLNSNFVGQTMGLDASQQGVLEAFRESCGIMAFGILAILAGIAEPVIAAVMLTLLGIGLSAYSIVPNYFWLVTASLVWSQGLHVWMPLPGSMAMSLAEPGQRGRRLGQISAAGAVGSAAGLVLALTLHLANVNIRHLWVLAGAAALLAAGACLAIPRQIKTPSPRILIRRKYGLYYLLCFLEGWRKQIFVAFAGYLLVTQYGTPLTTMLILWLITQAIGWFLSPAVGRLIDRIGERRVLMLYYSSMVIVFGGYICVRQPLILYGLFIVDSAFFTLSMALTSFVGRIAPPAEHTPTLSFGVAINHVAAVTMPLVGGYLWTHAGYRWAFAAGAAAACASVVVATLVPPKHS